jgi:hypothetical protein
MEKHDENFVFTSKKDKKRNENSNSWFANQIAKNISR